MRSIPEDLTTLISDLETFLTDVLKAENLSKKAKEKKDAFIKRIKDVKTSYSQEFKDKRDEEFPEPDEADTNDGGSLQSEQADRDDENAYDGEWKIVGFIAILKVLQERRSMEHLQELSGYLEKRRKDHSFFGNEWQKRWCALSSNIFYYYGSEKDKQQKGEFNIVGYTVKMNNTLRKDAKRDCCFEISAPDKRVYQFCAATEKDAKEWVEHIDFLIKGSTVHLSITKLGLSGVLFAQMHNVLYICFYSDMGGIIPEDEEEYDDCLTVSQSAMPAIIDDDIYEELPEEEEPQPVKPTVTLANKPPPPSTHVTAVNKSRDYENYFQSLWDCAGDHPDELSFKRGDTIYILSKSLSSCVWGFQDWKTAQCHVQCGVEVSLVENFPYLSAPMHMQAVQIWVLPVGFVPG
ncbi:Src kinase-associated phosphoprotein 2 [Anabarilius grahami]|uniref:Src kinase-associated phosphoprotein 2 n=1 Tax=Anabarilius grahami TaxID=495550 RepID=A0A3N0XIA9_ANAGA|nr:Src kinase-associated phosphoprotein 2 [Anabarilius grahami]